MKNIYSRSTLVFFTLFLSTLGWARVFQPAIKHQKATPPPLADELEMEHIEDIENAFHSSTIPTRDRRLVGHGRGSLFPWKRSSPMKLGSINEQAQQHSTVASSPPQEKIISSRITPTNKNNDLNNEESVNNLSSPRKSSSPLVSFGLRRSQASSQEPPPPPPLQIPEIDYTTQPTTPRTVSRSSIVIDPVAIASAAGTISKSLGNYVSHGLVSVSVAALVYAVAGKVGDSIIAKFNKSSNSKYIAELESQLLNFEFEREEEKAKMLTEFQDKLNRAQKEAENNMILKVEATRSKMIKLAQAKIDQLIERNKKLKDELSRYMKKSSASSPFLSTSSGEESSIGTQGMKSQSEVARKEIERLEQSLLETKAKLEQEKNVQIQLREEILKLKVFIEESKEEEGLDEKYQSLQKERSQWAKEIEQVRKESEISLLELEEKHKLELSETAAGHEKELLRLREMVSRAMRVDNISNDTARAMSTSM